MKLYRVKIPVIANSVIEELANGGSLEVLPENKAEAELDLIAIMEEYQRRDFSLRDAVREHMSTRGVPYDQYGKVRGRMADEWSHPTGDDVERFLARQFVENCVALRLTILTAHLRLEDLEECLRVPSTAWVKL